MGIGYSRPLKAHPNFAPPPAPAGVSVEEVVRFTLEYAAGLVSPAQEEGEDEERPCVDVAAELRGSAPAVLAALRIGAAGAP